MLLAHHLATWSIEKGRRVGTVIVGPDNEIRSTGFNGLPRGVRDDLEERHSRVTGAKYIWSCHAEQNAIFNAARIGVRSKVARSTCPGSPASNAPRPSSSPALTNSSPTPPTGRIRIGTRIFPSPARCSRKPASKSELIPGSPNFPTPPKTTRKRKLNQGGKGHFGSLIFRNGNSENRRLTTPGVSTRMICSAIGA